MSLNVKRRNLRKGQTAMAAAEAWVMVAISSHGEKRTRKQLPEMFGVGENAIQQARALLECDNPAARAVR